MKHLVSVDGAETMTFSSLERLKKEGKIATVKYHPAAWGEKLELYTVVFASGQTNVYRVEDDDTPSPTGAGLWT